MQQAALIAVTAEPPATLVLRYADGQLRRFDCTPYLERGVFTRLKDSALFGQAFVAHGTVCWPGDLDIAPETLFLRSTAVASGSTVAASH